MLRSLSATLLLLLALSACGGDDKDDAGSDFEQAVDDLPKCSEVWQVGKELDLSTYEGCQDGDTVEAVITRGCYKGTEYVGQFTTYNDELWVVQTGTDPQTGQGGTPGEITDVDPKC